MHEIVLAYLKGLTGGVWIRKTFKLSIVGRA